METATTEDSRHPVKWALATLFTVLAFLGAIGSAVGWWAHDVLLGAAGAWLVSIWITDLIIGQLLSGIVSEDAADVAEALLNGVTAGLDDLLRLMLIIAAIAGAGVVGWLRYSGRADEDVVAD